MRRNRRRRKAQNKEKNGHNIETKTRTADLTDSVCLLEDKSVHKNQEMPVLSNSEKPNVFSGGENCFPIETSISVENTQCNASKPCTMTDLELTPRSQHRDYYIHYLCQVCKAMPEPGLRESCDICKLVTYCSAEHKWTHWPSHNELCETLGDLFKHVNFTNTSPDDFRKIRVNMIEECEKIIKRPLEKSEREIILYYNRCFYCYERDKSVLDSCKICKHISFCREHTMHKEHDVQCASLVLYRNIVLHIIGDELTSLYFPDTFAKEMKEYDMKTLCSNETDNELECAFLSELATSPLSVLHTLKLVYENFQNVPQKLCIHIIGAENDFELSAIEKWEIFLGHLLSCSEIVLIFIGPELFHEDSVQFASCEECEVWSRKMSMKFQANSLYHDYVKGPDYVKPDLICSFNPGIYRSTGFNRMDSWRDTIEQILLQNVPVVVTAYTKVEILKDIGRIEQSAKLKFFQTPCENPFSSLKPFLSFVNDEVSPVIFKNQYYVIFKQY